jgi:hypothetical protein
MYFLYVWIGDFWFGVLCESARLVCVRPLHVFLFPVRVEYSVRKDGLVHVLVISLGLQLDKFISC